MSREMKGGKGFEAIKSYTMVQLTAGRVERPFYLYVGMVGTPKLKWQRGEKKCL